MTSSPSVAIVIPNWNGAAHLADCLDSIRALTYPAERFEVIVVDNGSTDDSRVLLDERYPEVRVITLAENLGFAEAANAGARAATSECIAFLNNDMRVDPGWLSGLVAAYDPDQGYVSVAGVILDWGGERLGFAGGWVTFHGSAGQEHFLQPMNEELIADLRDLPFACGGSMLVARDVFLQLGGFDPKYFAFYEDVDLGWRLWLAGYKVRLAGSSRCLHRHHATASSVPFFRRVLLYERNALFTLIKNVDDENLASLLSSSLFLLVVRSLLSTGSPREAFALEGADAAEGETVQRTGLAPLHAVHDVIEELPDLLQRRRDVQRLRRRTDREIFEMFGRPFAPAFQAEAYVDASVKTRSLFGVERLFPRQRATRVLVVSHKRSKRLAELARSLRVVTDVSLLTPGRKADVLVDLLGESDLVIADAATPHARTIADLASGVLVVDLADGAATPCSELLRRADAFLASRRVADGSLRSGRPLVVAPSDGDGWRRVLEIAERPWEWTRGERDSHQTGVPEDLQHLLRHRRERRAETRAGSHMFPTTRRFIPPPVESLLRRVLGRPRLSG